MCQALPSATVLCRSAKTFPGVVGPRRVVGIVVVILDGDVE